MVDLCITGTDRTTSRGDVCNKIGTYLKALGCQRQQRPLLRRTTPSNHRLVAMEDGAETPIEQRDEDEVLTIVGT